MRQSPGLRLIISYADTKEGHLGTIYQDLDQSDRAVAHHMRAHQLCPARIEALNNLGLVTWNQGDLKAAREYHEQALAIRKELAPRSQRVAGSLGNLGLVAKSQGDLETARSYFIRALALFRIFVSVDVEAARRWCVSAHGTATDARV